MSIQKINSTQNFNGIRRVVRNVPLNEALAIQSMTKNSPSNPIVPQSSRLISKITNLFSGKKNVGSITQFTDGTFVGVRYYADGTTVVASTSKLLTKKFGETLFSNVSVRGKNILTPSIPYKPFNKSGQPQFPTLKEIKAYNKPENILKLVQEGKLKIVRADKV